MAFDDLAVARVIHVASMVGWIGGVWFVTFVVMPLFLHRRMAQSPAPEADFRRMTAMHRVLSLVALVKVPGGVAGAHGML